MDMKFHREKPVAVPASEAKKAHDRKHNKPISPEPSATAEAVNLVVTGEASSSGGSRTSSGIGGGTTGIWTDPFTTPRIGDFPIDKGTWTDPNTWTLPGVPITPTVPVPAPNYTYTLYPQQDYWGVQRKSNPEKGGPEYWVVNPETVNSLALFGARFVARCESEAEAKQIAELFNKQEERSQPAKTCTCGPREECSNCPPESKRSERQLDFKTASSFFLKGLQGRVLTVIDASITHERQNKSFKQVINREFRQVINNMADYCYKGVAHPEVVTHESDDPDLAL